MFDNYIVFPYRYVLQIKVISGNCTLSELPAQFSSVTQSCPTVSDLMDCSSLGLPVHHQLSELAQTHVQLIELVMPSNHLILCHPLLLLPSVFASIRVFSKESALHIRWSKCWSFSSSISPSNKYLGLISFRVDWLDLLAVQGTLKNLFQHHRSKASILEHSALFFFFFFHGPPITSIPDYWKNHSFD